jgi:uncharacterized protein
VLCRNVDARGGFLDTILILNRYFSGDSLDAVVEHSMAVAGLASTICSSLGFSDDERLFVEQASMLHDIGVSRVNAPEIAVYGGHPYIMHGVLGRAILEAEGLPRHALICERHIGVGLTIGDIVSQNLNLPLRDMTPLDVAEEIVCFADLFYSKKPGKLDKRKSAAEIRKKLFSFGLEKVQIFDLWVQRFGSAL